MGAKLLFLSHAASACDLNANTSNFSTQIAAATTGQTVCLASGDYGTWTGTNKDITITAASGASPQIIIKFGSSYGSGASGLTLNGFANISGVITGGASNITIQNSTFSSDYCWTGCLYITGAVSNILISHNNFIYPYTSTASGPNSKIFLDTTGNSPGSAVTVEYNDIENGDLDGVHIGGGSGMLVKDNEFKNLCDQGVNHTDNIQFQGASETDISGNYIYEAQNCPTQGITSYDGGTNGAVIENNVVDISRDWGIEFYSDTNSIIRHNTVVYHSKSYSQFGTGTGDIDLENKSADPAGTGTHVYDNVASTSVVSPTTGTFDHNTDPSTTTYVGGSSPTTHDGFLLTSASTGHLAASDGTDTGIYAIGNITYGPLSGGSIPANTDLNSDDTTNVFDLSVLLSHYGQTGSNLPGDFNSDGTVNSTDLSILQTNWGDSSGGPANMALPAISGTPDTATYVAPQLVVSSGVWSGSPDQYTYQWQDCNSYGNNCVNAAGETYGPGASGSKCVNSTAAYGCAYNLVAGEATAPCPYTSGGTGACIVKVIVTAAIGSAGTSETLSAGQAINSNPSHPWPNYSNTGYQNAPALSQYGTQSYAAATGGTEGVPDSSMLTVASASSPTCPTTIQSNHTYSFCWYKDTCPANTACLGLMVGSPGAHVSNVHFIGDLFESKNSYDPTNGYEWDDDMSMYCDNNCTFDYTTFKPSDLNVPDLPMPGHGLPFNGNPIGHGVTYASGTGELCDCGSAYNTVGHGISITHSDMWGAGSGIILGTNSSSTPNVIQDNWIHDQADCELDSFCTEHTDGIGMVNTGSSTNYVTVDHNNMPFIQDNTNNIAFQSGTYDHLAVTNNIISGDGYTVAIWNTSSNVTFSGNLWTNYSQQGYNVNYGQDFWDTSGSIWAHNKFGWDPTGVNPLWQWGPFTDSNYTPYGSQYTSANDGECWVPSGLSKQDYNGGSC